MKNISAIQDIERTKELLGTLEKPINGSDEGILQMAELYLSVALDKLKELEIKIRNL